MKILKQGRKVKKYLRFTCKNCDCVFLAEKNEYKFEGRYYHNDRYSDRYSCTCPNCNVKTYSTAEDEIVEE